MSRIRTLVTLECDRCGRQQNIDILDPDVGQWCEYENIHLNNTITLCPTCVMFFYEFMHGKEVKGL